MGNSCCIHNAQHKCCCQNYQLSSANMQLIGKDKLTASCRKDNGQYVTSNIVLKDECYSTKDTYRFVGNIDGKLRECSCVFRFR